MYGYSYTFLGDTEKPAQRSASIPVINRQMPNVSDNRRAMSLSLDAIERVWHESKGKPSFSDYLRNDLLPKAEPLIEISRESTLTPVLVTLLVGQGALLFGIEIGFSSPTNGQIKNVLGISNDQIGLLWSWLNIGAMVGCLSAAPFADFLGRKRALIVMTIPFLAGGAIFYLVQNYVLMSAARLGI